jgi:hypothetical protein
VSAVKGYVVKVFAVKCNLSVNLKIHPFLDIYHPPYSPDLFPSDYFLFPKLIVKLKELHFADVAEI